MNDHSMEHDPLEAIISEFSERLRRGEVPSVPDYVQKYPDWAQEIQELLPTIEELERLKKRNERTARELVSLGPLRIEKLDDFRFVREIGRGGMGIVYEAEQESLGRRVAIKVLPRQPWSDAEHLEQFKREAQTAAGLHHTHIVQIYGVGEDDGFNYYAMQLIDGIGLDRIIRWLATDRDQTAAPGTTQLGPICKQLFGSPHDVNALTSTYWNGVARIGQQAAGALAYAHGQGIIHRDIKPGNLLVDQQGVVWVTDFGLARPAEAASLVQPGSLTGTLRYLSPEQFQGQVDTRSDVYALGMTLYELLTRQPAYDAADQCSLIRCITQRDPVAPRQAEPRVPRDLEAIVLKAIAHDPERRYQSAAALSEDLYNYLQGRPVAARHLRAPERLWLWAKRNPMVATLSLTAATLLLIACMVGWIGYLQTERALNRESNQLKKTQAEYGRAQANLDVALQAFEDVFDRMTVGQSEVYSSATSEEGPVYEPIVSTRDVDILRNLLAFYDQFAAQNQEVTDLRRESARAYYRVGQIYNRLGQFRKAKEACRIAQELYQQLTAEPSVPVTERIEGYLELGWATQMLGQHQEARNIYTSAMDVLTDSSGDHPQGANIRYLLAQVHLRLGSVSKRRSDQAQLAERERRRGEPLDHTQTALTLLGNLLTRDPNNPRYARAMGHAQHSLAQLHFRADRVLEAEEAIAQAISVLTDLRMHYPDEDSYLYDLALIYTTEEGRAGHPAGQRREVVEVWKQRYQRAWDFATLLVSRHPTVPAYLALLSRSHLRRADVCLREGKRKEAEQHLVQAQRKLQQLIGQELAASTYVCDYLKATESLSRLWQRNHRSQEARSLLERDLDRIEGLLKTSPRRRREWELLVRQYDTLARICSSQGDHARAQEVAERTHRIREAQGFDRDERSIRPPRGRRYQRQ